jgi:hypothetical protein
MVQAFKQLGVFWYIETHIVNRSGWNYIDVWRRGSLNEVAKASMTSLGTIWRATTHTL